MQIQESPPSRPERHRAMFRITAQMLAQFVTNGAHHYQIEGGVPEGGRVLGAYYDLPSDCFLVGVEHESLPVCHENQIAEQIKPSVTYTGGFVPKTNYTLNTQRMIERS